MFRNRRKRRKVKRQKPRQSDKIILKSKAEIEKMRHANRLVAECFAQLDEAIEPGMRLRDLDKLVESIIKAKGAHTLYKGYRGNPPKNPPFPGVICASVNREVCHGIPDNRILHEGDIIGIDIGLRYNGFCGDACVTFAVGNISPAAQHLLDITQECLALGIKTAQVGTHLSDIGLAIERHANSHRFSVVREWGGHGVGRNLHEPPSVPHHGPGGQGPKLRPGMVFTIEPMINAGKPEWTLLEDGWSVITKDGSLSAQFEHTIAITRNGPDILSKL